MQKVGLIIIKIPGSVAYKTWKKSADKIIILLKEISFFLTFNNDITFGIICYHFCIGNTLSSKTRKTE